MCHFISWYESKDGALFYLTDAEIFSARGREIAEQIKNDALGHGAICAYFDLKADQLIRREEPFFWLTEKLPSEIAQKIENFDRHWGKMFKEGYFPSYILTDVILHYVTPKIWREKFFEQFKQQISSHKFLYSLDFQCLVAIVILGDSKACRKSAWKILIKNKKSVSTTFYRCLKKIKNKSPDRLIRWSATILEKFPSNRK